MREMKVYPIHIHLWIYLENFLDHKLAKYILYHISNPYIPTNKLYFTLKIKEHIQKPIGLNTINIIID